MIWVSLRLFFFSSSTFSEMQLWKVFSFNYMKPSCMKQHNICVLVKVVVVMIHTCTSTNLICKFVCFKFITINWSQSSLFSNFLLWMWMGQFHSSFQSIRMMPRTEHCAGHISTSGVVLIYSMLLHMNGCVKESCKGYMDFFDCWLIYFLGNTTRFTLNCSLIKKIIIKKHVKFYLRKCKLYHDSVTDKVTD